MPRPTPSTIAAILTTTLLSATLALAQAEPHPASSTSAINLPAGPHNDWAEAATSYGGKSPVRKLIVLTLAQPAHRHTCRVQSFTPDQLVCKGSFGKTHTYKPQEIAALIRPGDHDLRLRFLLGFNGALAAATWGTVVLAATCIPCAVATGVAALFFFAAAGVAWIADPEPEALFYLTPGQTLHVKLHD